MINARLRVDVSTTWTVVTRDRSLSAQFEHTLVVTKSGCEILTARDRPLVGSETVAPLATVEVHP
jgi:methionyl aminopeptidase